MKNWWESKTIWANVAIAVAAVAQFLPELRDVIPAHVYPVVLFIVAVVNMTLRGVTTQPISQTQKLLGK